MDFQTLGPMQLYRASDALMTHREAIEEHLFDRAMGLFDLHPTVTLYDLSNTYFEGEARAQPKARHGHSKDKRTDCPLLTLGLVLDGSGFVRRSQVFAGNVREHHTLAQMLEALNERCPGRRTRRLDHLAGQRLEHEMSLRGRQPSERAGEDGRVERLAGVRVCLVQEPAKVLRGFGIARGHWASCPACDGPSHPRHRPRGVDERPQPVSRGAVVGRSDGAPACPLPKRLQQRAGAVGPGGQDQLLSGLQGHRRRHAGTHGRRH